MVYHDDIKFIESNLKSHFLFMNKQALNMAKLKFKAKKPNFINTKLTFISMILNSLIALSTVFEYFYTGSSEYLGTFVVLTLSSMAMHFNSKSNKNMVKTNLEVAELSYDKNKYEEIYYRLKKEYKEYKELKES